MKMALIILNTKIHEKSQSFMRCTQKQTRKKRVNKLTHKIDKCMTSVTFLVLDAALFVPTPPAHVASGL